MTTLAVLEQREGVLRKICHEVVTAAQRLGDGVDAVVCGVGPVQGTDQIGKFGADKVVTLTNLAFAKYAPEACAQALAERAKQGGYRTIVFAASATGKDLAPRVAAKLGVGVARPAAARRSRVRCCAPLMLPESNSAVRTWEPDMRWPGDEFTRSSPYEAPPPPVP